MGYSFEIRQPWPVDTPVNMSDVPRTVGTTWRRLVHADMDGETFDAAWLRIRWQVRYLLYLLVILLGTGLALSSRVREWALESVGRDYTVDENDDLFEITELMLKRRDQVMIKKIEAFWDFEPDYRGQAAGIFGAAHLPAIINHLVDRRGFRITFSRWVMAIPAD